jgi:D-alanine transaminase
LNGHYIALAEATVSPLDRAFLFGDAVYEVVPVYGSRPFRLREHLARLERSLAQIRMQPPLAPQGWSTVCRELLQRNGAQDAYLYIQVTRGMEFGRSHAWPEGLKPTLFAYVTSLEPLSPAVLEQGVSAVTAPDIRWGRRDIKSTALLGNILLKKLAADAGAYETIMLENGELTEGSSTTVHVIKDGAVHTPPNGRHILPGTTRDVVTELAQRLQIRVETAAVPESLLRSADEVWLAFATRGVLPVTRLDGIAVADGRPGPLFTRMAKAFAGYIRELAGTPAL